MFDWLLSLVIVIVMITDLEKVELRAVIKESVSEVLEQRKDYFMSIFEEVIEDKFLLEAIKEGEASGVASRKDVFETLKS